MIFCTPSTFIFSVRSLFGSHVYRDFVFPAKMTGFWGTSYRENFGIEPLATGPLRSGSCICCSKEANSHGCTNHFWSPTNLPSNKFVAFPSKYIDSWVHWSVNVPSQPIYVLPHMWPFTLPCFFIFLVFLSKCPQPLLILNQDFRLVAAVNCQFFLSGASGPGGSRCATRDVH